jgi:hypothetical protein
MQIDSARWRRIRALFEQAVELGTDERENFLDSACHGDVEQRRQVASLLLAGEGSDEAYHQRVAIKRIRGILAVEEAPAGSKIKAGFRRPNVWY